MDIIGKIYITPYKNIIKVVKKKEDYWIAKVIMTDNDPGNYGVYIGNHFSLFRDYIDKCQEI